MEHIPAAMIVTVLPDTVQADEVEAKLIANPELDVAVIVKAATPKTTLFNAPNATVWLTSVLDTIDELNCVASSQSRRLP